MISPLIDDSCIGPNFKKQKHNWEFSRCFLDSTHELGFYTAGFYTYKHLFQLQMSLAMDMIKMKEWTAEVVTVRVAVTTPQ